jgi:hypothetical protein
MRFHKIAFCTLLFLIAPFLLKSQTVQKHQEIDSARLFVQRFYDWYVPLAHKLNKESSSDVAIKIKPALFDNKLLTALGEDSAAQGKKPGYIVGLDFDPFLNSQDPSDRYDVGKVHKEGNNYFVTIYSTRDGIKSDEPSVTAEIVRRNNTWIFVNFHYSSGDLLSVLSVLKIERFR